MYEWDNCVHTVTVVGDRDAALNFDELDQIVVCRSFGWRRFQTSRHKL